MENYVCKCVTHMFQFFGPSSKTTLFGHNANAADFFVKVKHIVVIVTVIHTDAKTLVGAHPRPLEVLTPFFIRNKEMEALCVQVDQVHYHSILQLFLFSIGQQGGSHDQETRFNALQ